MKDKDFDEDHIYSIWESGFSESEPIVLAGVSKD